MNSINIVFGKKLVKRDEKGRKMTQKGAKHHQNAPKQPNRSELTNHDRIQIRMMTRQQRERDEFEEDMKFMKRITK